MNSDELQGKWKQLKGSIKERWGELTDDDVAMINGQSDQLIGRIQERYGIARAEAQEQVEEWMHSDAEEFDVEERKAS